MSKKSNIHLHSRNKRDAGTIVNILSFMTPKPGTLYQVLSSIGLVFSCTCSITSCELWC